MSRKRRIEPESPVYRAKRYAKAFTEYQVARQVIGWLQANRQFPPEADIHEWSLDFATGGDNDTRAAIETALKGE